MRKERSAGAFIYACKNMKFKFLLIKRLNYGVPKGHLEKGEDDEAAARRETFEETGLRISLIPNFYVDTRYSFGKGERIGKTVRFFLARTKTQRVRLDSEHSGYVWSDYSRARRKIKFRNLRRALALASDYAMRYEAWKEVNEHYSMLSERKDWRLSRNFVPGEGPLNARVMLVGQAPGKKEDRLKRPFVGRSGQLLSEALRAAKIDRGKAYIASVVQFFPEKNRIPTDSEVMLCTPFLMRQIMIVKPKYIITLGNVASKTVLGIAEAEKNHGYIIKKKGITYMMSFHPAAALRFKRVRKLFLADVKYFGKLIGKAP